MLRILGFLTIFMLALSAVLVYQYYYVQDIPPQTKVYEASEAYDDEGNLWVVDERMSYVLKSEAPDTAPGFNGDFVVLVDQRPTLLQCTYEKVLNGRYGILEFPLASPILFRLSASKLTYTHTRRRKLVTNTEIDVMQTPKQLSQVGQATAEQALIKCLNAVKSGQLNEYTKIFLPRSAM